MNPINEIASNRKNKPLTPEELEQLTDTVIILNQVNHS
jgi:uncharacterized protein YnzC (UPF0291/DUF896 family)